MMKPLKVMRPSVALHASVDVSGSGGEDIADEWLWKISQQISNEVHEFDMGKKRRFPTRIDRFHFWRVEFDDLLVQAPSLLRKF